MKKTNWSSVEKSAKIIKKNVKNTKQVKEFLDNYPAEGYMRDNISKKQLAIAECKSSSLRRYIKLLENFYYLSMDQSEKARILTKKIEIEIEIAKRPDGLKEE